MLVNCSEDASEEDPAGSERPSRTDPSKKSSTKGSSESKESTSSSGEKKPVSDSTDDTAPTKGSVTLQTPLKDLPAECKGFEVLGLEHSPGGSTLPNKCAPFDSLLNNPYAIRCVDANPNYKTKYAGDELCILPPPVELGTQVYLGPEDYDDPGMFELAPGVEETRAYYINATNEEEHYFYRTNVRVRKGQHHIVISSSDSDQEDGWIEDQSSAGGDFDPANIPPDFDPANFDSANPPPGFDPASFDPSSSGGFGSGGSLTGVMSGNFGVTQRLNHDRPQGTLEVPPENQGLGGVFQAKQQMAFNLHHYNFGEEPILRELWVNIWYMAEKDVTTKLQPLAINGNPRDVAIPPKQHTVLNYECDVQGDTRIITLYGHRHAQTERFGISIEKASGETFTVYESFNYDDMPAYQYDSVSSNPKPDVEKKIDGGSSGELKLAKGDKIHFVCDINNKLDVPLRFANETITGEMCIVFGSYSGEQPCSGLAKRVMD